MILQSLDKYISIGTLITQTVGNFLTVITNIWNEWEPFYYHELKSFYLKISNHK